MARTEFDFTYGKPNKGVLYPMRICHCCGSQFKAPSFKSLYCSDHCEREMQRSDEERREEYKEYLKQKRYNRTMRYNNIASSYNLQEYESEYMVKKCVICGKRFLSHYAITCSSKCMDEYLKKNKYYDDIKTRMNRYIFKRMTKYIYPGAGKIVLDKELEYQVNRYELAFMKILQYNHEIFTYQTDYYPLTEGRAYISPIWRFKNNTYYDFSRITMKIYNNYYVAKYLELYSNESNFIKVKHVTKAQMRRYLKFFRKKIKQLGKIKFKQYALKEKFKGQWRKCLCCNEDFFATRETQKFINAQHMIRYHKRIRDLKDKHDRIINADISEQERHEKLAHLKSRVLFEKRIRKHHE